MWSEVELTCYYMNLCVSDLQRVIIGATYKRDDKQRQPTCWAEDSHVSMVYLYMSCVQHFTPSFSAQRAFNILHQVLVLNVHSTFYIKF